MTIYEISALAAAASWALGGILSAMVVKPLGVLAFNRFRLSLAVVLLLPIIYFSKSYIDFNWGHWPLIFVSGVFGIIFGDAMLFACMERMGPRRSAVLFSLHAPLSTLFGYIILSEVLSIGEVIGIILSFFGVAIAIFFGKRKDQQTKFEDLTHPIWIGVAFGLLAAAGQAIGALAIRPVMNTGSDPFMVSALRILIGAVGFWIIYFIIPNKARAKTAINKDIWLGLFGNAIFGMALGMTLAIFAFKGAEVGIASTLSATTPVIILPMLWLFTKERPALGAWIGASIVVIATGLIIMW